MATSIQKIVDRALAAKGHEIAVTFGEGSRFRERLERLLDEVIERKLRMAFGGLTVPPKSGERL